MNRSLVALAAFVIAAMPCAALAQQSASFGLSGVQIDLPLPKGFCLPSGKAIDVAQLVAAADKDNVTDLSLFPCGNDGSAADYYLVKTPARMMNLDMTRVQLLAAVGAEFDNPELNAFLASDKINDATTKAYADTAHMDITLKGSVRPLGRDDVCAYMGGVLDFTSGSIAYSRAVSACITAVSGRVVFIYRYSEGETANVLKMLPVAKALALSMRGKPAQ